MPVIAVAVAAVAIGVAVEVGTTVAIIAAVGATIGAVGAVTGNKELAIAGGVIGAIGAIGGLASAAGIFSSAASGTSLFDAGGLASDGGFAGAVGADVAAGGGGSLSAQAQALVDAGLNPGTQSAGISSSVMGGSIPANGDIINMASGQVTTPDVALNAAPANAQPADVTPVTATDKGPVTLEGSQTATLDSQGAPPTPSVTVPATPGTPSATSSILNGGQGVTGVPASSTQQALVDAGLSPGTQSPGISSDVALGGNWSPSGTSPFGGVWNFVQKNGTLVSGSIQAGAALLAGATDTLKPAQIKALEAQANANQAAANLSANQLANLNAPIPVARRTGMINSPPVTGVAA